VKQNKQRQLKNVVREFGYFVAPMPDALKELLPRRQTWVDEDEEGFVPSTSPRNSLNANLLGSNRHQPGEDLAEEIASLATPLLAPPPLPPLTPHPPHTQPPVRPSRLLLLLRGSKNRFF